MVFSDKIMSVPFWVKFQKFLEYVLGIHDMCLKIWSCFPHSFSEQLNFHIHFVETKTIYYFKETEINSFWFQLRVKK